MLLKQNLVFKIFHVYTHTDKYEILPVLSLLIAGSFNISLHKIQFFSPNFLMRKFSLNGQFQQVFERISRKATETVALRKISSPRHQVKNIVFYTVFIELRDDFYFQG